MKQPHKIYKVVEGQMKQPHKIYKVVEEGAGGLMFYVSKCRWSLECQDGTLMTLSEAADVVAAYQGTITLTQGPKIIDSRSY